MAILPVNESVTEVDAGSGWRVDVRAQRGGWGLRHRHLSTTSSEPVEVPADGAHPDRPSDRAAVFAVHTAAFARPDGGEVPEAKLVSALRAAGDVIPALSIVALINEEVVGHVVCSRASIDGRPSVGLGPLGVPPAYHRRGVGQALMHAILASADALDEPAVVLPGDLGCYRKCGFQLAEPLGILPADPQWAEHFQVRPLNAWDGSLRGIFRYAKAFDAL
jgi:putative acetyltransferase